MSTILKECHQVIDNTLTDVELAIKHAKSGKSVQISKADDRDYFKSVAYAWFHARRPAIEELWSEIDLTQISDCFATIIDSTAKKAARSTYQSSLKCAKQHLIELRRTTVSIPTPLIGTTNDSPPDFSRLVSDNVMQQILQGHWNECQKCIAANAYLAATVMMGGLLEALFVAYANTLADKSPMFSAKTTPRDSKTKKPIQLSKWTLRPYIDVGHELGWISVSYTHLTLPTKA